MIIFRAAARSISPIRRTLDIGCGAGNLTRRLLQRVAPLNCYLLDLSRDRKKECRGKAKHVRNEHS